MKRLSLLIAWFALACLLFAAPASAQAPIEGEGSMQVGNATVSVGGGTAILTLPDVSSFITLLGPAPRPRLETFKFSDDFDDETGWNINGSVAVPMSGGKVVSLNGFWANIEDDDSFTCNAPVTQTCGYSPIVDDPATFQGITFGIPVVANTERDVDQWGVSLEVKQQLNPGVMGVTQAPPRRTLALGVDVRGINQDLDVTITSPPSSLDATYDEELDTTYYGAYLAWGGDYSLPFLSELTSGWGLRSSFMLRGGVYHAATDYQGRLNSPPVAGSNATSALSLSEDDIAFIGGLVLETRKRIGARATLSLKSEYEYYSWVPKIAYNTIDTGVGIGNGLNGPGHQVGTVINDDDAFSMRTSLRLTIKLGPDSVFEEPLK